MAVVAAATSVEAEETAAGVAASTAVVNVTVALSILLVTEVTVGRTFCVSGGAGVTAGNDVETVLVSEVDRTTGTGVGVEPGVGSTAG
jgi:hypothetical protein